jgi:hypothetical protein
MDADQERIGDMTRAELRKFVGEVVYAKVRHWPHNPQRPPAEVFASVVRNRWTPPSGAKTSQELLRESRDQ